MVDEMLLYCYDYHEWTRNFIAQKIKDSAHANYHGSSIETLDSFGIPIQRMDNLRSLNDINIIAELLRSHVNINERSRSSSF